VGAGNRSAQDQTTRRSASKIKQPLTQWVQWVNPQPSLSYPESSTHPSPYPRITWDAGSVMPLQRAMPPDTVDRRGAGKKWEPFLLSFFIPCLLAAALGKAL
jgi:hypothetical protein